MFRVSEVVQVLDLDYLGQDGFDVSVPQLPLSTQLTRALTGSWILRFRISVEKPNQNKIWPNASTFTRGGSVFMKRSHDTVASPVILTVEGPAQAH